MTTIRFFRMGTDYYSGPALARAGEAAEVLYVRAQAYAARQETGNVLPREALPLLGLARTTARVNALVREGLLVKRPEGGWTIAGALDQETTDTLARRREQGRTRSQAYRDRKAAEIARDGAGDIAGDASRHASRDASPSNAADEEVDVDAACGSTTREPPPLPMPVQILRQALEAHRLVVRWDRLTPAEHAEIEGLIERHGDLELIRAAQRQHRPDRPAAFADAWLNGWRELDRRGRLELVRSTADPCTLPGHNGTTRHCIECAAEKHGGDR